MLWFGISRGMRLILFHSCMGVQGVGHTAAVSAAMAGQRSSECSAGNTSGTTFKTSNPFNRAVKTFKTLKRA
jgi:hypothetical protein